MVQAYNQIEMDLWESAARNIGVNLEPYSKVERKKLVGSGLEFELILAPERKKRLVQDTKVENNWQGKTPDSLCMELRRWEEKGDNMLDSREYSDYLVCPNKFPIEKGHVVIINKDCQKKQVNHVDLEEMLRLSNERGYCLWRNMEGAAQTVPHEHFQGLYGSFPTDKLEIISLVSGQNLLKNYPWANFVFKGEGGTIDAEEKMIEWKVMESKDIKIPYTIVCSNNRICVFPIRIPQGRGGIGGLETGLEFVAYTKEEYENTNAEDLIGRLGGALYSWPQYREFMEKNKVSS